MSPTYVVVPQWQGSGSSRAMRLVDGAEAIRGDLPSASTIVVDVPLEAGEAQDSGIARYTSLQLVRDRQTQVLAGLGDWALTIGGDCGVSLASVAHAAAKQDIALVWFDAHPDLNTPETSPSSAFGGMVLRTLMGEGAPDLVPARPVAPERIVLAGVRSVDDGEDLYLEDSPIRVLTSEQTTTDTIVDWVRGSGAAAVYIHIDLDVLDPTELQGVADPMPFGVQATTLVDTVKALVSAFPIAGATIAQFSPASAEQAGDDMPTILRIIGALTSRPA